MKFESTGVDWDEPAEILEALERYLGFDLPTVYIDAEQTKKDTIAYNMVFNGYPDLTDVEDVISVFKDWALDTTLGFTKADQDKFDQAVDKLKLLTPDQYKAYLEGS